MVRAMKALGLGWGWARQGEDAAALLAARRRKKGFSQAALAEKAGCSRPTIIALERDFSGSVSILLSVLAALGVRQVLRALDMPGRAGLVPVTNAPVRDLVMTPAPLAAAVIAHFAEQISGSILDPARGQGAFFDQFPSLLQRRWCEVSEGKDFHAWSEPVDWIVTNPPWSRLRDFTLHAMNLAPNIIWLAPIVNLTTKARLRDLDEYGFGIAELLLIETPKCWPQSGFQLAAAHLKKGHQGAWQVSRLGLVVK
nr:helix-turn-helix transcriptional regulator [Pseudotabrizicola alkalilacus]